MSLGQYRPFPGLPNTGALMPVTTRTEKMVIPSACAGSVIGRNGSIIKDIKTQSGTKISLAADSSPTGDRIVTITGSIQGIQIASFLIRQRVESQQHVQQQQSKKSQGAPTTTPPSSTPDTTDQAK